MEQRLTKAEEQLICSQRMQVLKKDRPSSPKEGNLAFKGSSSTMSTLSPFRATWSSGMEPCWLALKPSACGKGSATGPHVFSHSSAPRGTPGWGSSTTRPVVVVSSSLSSSSSSSGEQQEGGEDGKMRQHLQD